VLYNFMVKCSHYTVCIINLVHQNSIFGHLIFKNFLGGGGAVCFTHCASLFSASTAMKFGQTTLGMLPPALKRHKKVTNSFRLLIIDQWVKYRVLIIDTLCWQLVYNRLSISESDVLSDWWPWSNWKFISRVHNKK